MLRVMFNVQVFSELFQDFFLLFFENVFYIRITVNINNKKKATCYELHEKVLEEDVQ